MNLSPFIRNTVYAFCTLVLTTIFFPGHAQQGSRGLTLTGKLTAEDDREAIAHATISIANKGIATATNTAGKFVLIIPAANLSDTLKASCIGFKTRYFPVAGLVGGSELDIVLEKNTTELKEVSVAYYDSEKILQKAIGRIPENYINQPHVLSGFYRLYTFSDTIPLQLSEAVFDVYNFGYADKRADQFKLTKARTERNERDFSFLELGKKPNSVFEDDVVNHRAASGFLSDAGLKDHVFKVTGITEFQGYEAYEVYFNEAVGASENTFSGRMYIDTKTFAFIFFEFGSIAPNANGLGSGNFIAKALVKPADIQIGTTSDRTEVSFQEVNHKWVLAHVAGDYALTIKGPGQTDNRSARVKFNYQVTAVDSAPKSSFGSKLDRNVDINQYRSDGDPKFWNEFNILLPDYDAEEVFAQIQGINKQAKVK